MIHSNWSNLTLEKCNLKGIKQIAFDQRPTYNQWCIFLADIYMQSQKLWFFIRLGHDRHLI